MKKLYYKQNPDSKEYPLASWDISAILIEILYNKEILTMEDILKIFNLTEDQLIIKVV